MYALVVHRVPIFGPIYNEPFLSYRHFGTRSPNDPKMALNTKRLKVPYTYSTSTRESQISIPFDLPPAIVKLQANV